MAVSSRIVQLRQVPTWPHGSRATEAGESQQTRQRGEAVAAAVAAAAGAKGAEGCPPAPPPNLEAFCLLSGEEAGGSLTSAEAVRKTRSPATECLLARASALIMEVVEAAGTGLGEEEQEGLDAAAAAAAFLLFFLLLGDGDGEHRAGSRRELP